MPNRKPMDEREPWAVAFSQAINKWLKENMVTGRSLAKRLNIPLRSWEHAASASTLTQAEYYARVFFYTGINEADPRTMPRRAMTQSDWVSWVEANRDLYQIPTDEWDDLDESPTTDAMETTPESDILESLLDLTDHLQSILDSPESTIRAFVKKYGNDLRQLYKVLSVLSIEDPEDRLAAIEANRRFARK